MPEEDVASPEDFSAQVERYVSTAQRRDRVPSRREVEIGVAPEGFVYRPAVAEPKPPRLPFKQQMRKSVGRIRPSGIADEPSGRFALVVFGLLATVAQMDDIAIAVALPIIRLDLGFDFQAYFAIIGMSQFGLYLMTPFLGYLADRVSRVRMVQVGAVLGNVSSVVAAVSSSGGVLGATRFAAGLGPGIRASAMAPLMADYFPIEKRTRAFGFLGAMGQIGPPLGALTAVFGIYILKIDWRLIIGTLGVLATAATVATFWLKEPRRGEVDRKAMGMSDEAAADVPPPVSWGEAWRVSSSIHTLRRLWYAAPLTTIGQVGLGQLMFYVMTQKAANAGDQFGAGLLKEFPWVPLIVLSALPALVGFFLTAWFTPIIAQWVKRRPAQVLVAFGASQMVTVLGLLFFILNPLLILNMFVAPIMIVPIALLSVGYSMLLSVITPARIRGQAMASIAPFQLIGVLLLPVLGGIADQYGVVTAAYAVIPFYIGGTLVLMTGGATVDRDIRAALASSVAEEEVRRARSSGTDKMVVARDVDVTYAGTTVLFHVDFDVDEGELVAVLGTNGAGKSTLLKAIAGIHHPSNGAIFLDGEDITHKSAHLNAAKGIVFLPGGRAVFPTLTVAENLRLALWVQAERADTANGQEADGRTKTGKAHDGMPFDEVFELFPVLSERLEQQAGDLSGGEQQMLALAQAFLMRPRLLMIDELSLGLAPAVVERLLESVRAIHARGTTVVLVEQSVNVALTVAERAVFMDKGTKLFDGPTSELLNRPDLVRSVYLGGGGARPPRVSRPPRTKAGVVPEPVLVAEDVRVTFGGVIALAGVSIDARPSEVVGIIGPNGAGKTTLFDAIAGFARIDGGRILLDGEDVTDLPPDARAALGLGRSFQNTRLFPSLTVFENIAVSLDRHIEARSAVLGALWTPGVRKSERRTARRVEALIEVLGLGSFSNKFVSELSTGSRRLVEMACIMALDPTVLLLDEPSSGLAQAETEVLGPTIVRLARETGAAVLVIEHDMPLLVGTADRLVAMNLGSKVLEGLPSDVIADPLVVTTYLGADPAVIRRSGNPVLVSALAALGDAAETPTNNKQGAVHA